MNKKTLAVMVALIVGAAFYRVFAAVYVSALPNFSPLMAVAFCGALVLPGALALTLPLACVFASDLILNAYYGQPLVGPMMIGSYACYLMAIGFGRAMRGQGVFPVLGVTVLNALIFYVVTNTLSWIHNPHYAQNFAGLIQSLTVGRPGFAPTWTFFRNSLTSDLLFTGVFLTAFYWAKKRNPSPSLARQESSL